MLKYIQLVCFINLILLQIEPFFVSLALYDVAKGLKISETFHMDLNDRQMQQMLEERGRNDVGEPQNLKDTAIGACGLKVNEKWPISIKQVYVAVYHSTE